MVRSFSNKEGAISRINRLVLIGNGFDLSHSFKTRYYDFILNYFKSIFENFLNKDIEHEDLLLTLKYNNPYNKYANTGRIFKIKSFEEINTHIEKFKKDKLCSLIFNSQLIENLYTRTADLNWVDIENEYFDILKKNKTNEANITKLNAEFDFLKKRFENYLSSLKIEDINFSSLIYSDVFNETIKKEDVVIKTLNSDLKPTTVYLLNFNYTPTIFNYYDKLKEISNESYLNFIHGELNNPNNEIVFGFGDEMDKDYLQFEDLKNNDLFTHIKSFKYSQTSNYHNLVRFIESDYFQVFIIGHSCGLSDRTMLNYIFEHDNCISIRIFFYQKNNKDDDFTEKTYEISRHFKDKGLMRMKLIPKDKSRPIPKVKRLN